MKNGNAWRNRIIVGLKYLLNANTILLVATFVTNLTAPKDSGIERFDPMLHIFLHPVVAIALPASFVLFRLALVESETETVGQFPIYRNWFFVGAILTVWFTISYVVAFNSLTLVSYFRSYLLENSLMILSIFYGYQLGVWLITGTYADILERGKKAFLIKVYYRFEDRIPIWIRRCLRKLYYTTAMPFYSDSKERFDVRKGVITALAIGISVAVYIYLIE